MTNAKARFNNSLRPRKPEGSLGRTAQDGHLDSRTAPELCVLGAFLCLKASYIEDTDVALPFIFGYLFIILIHLCKCVRYDCRNHCVAAYTVTNPDVVQLINCLLHSVLPSGIPNNNKIKQTKTALQLS